MFFNSPLEQFSIFHLINLNSGMGDLSITNSSIALFSYLVFILWMSFLSLEMSNTKFMSSNWFFMWGESYKLVLSSIFDNAGHKGLVYFNLVLTVFTTVLVLNLFGLVPYSFTVTAHMSFTACMSFSLWLGTVFLGFYNHGLNFFSMFLPKDVPLVLAIPLIFIELISYLVSPLSLGISLAANLTAGHLLLALGGGFLFFMVNTTLFFLAWAPFLLLIVFTFLELAVAFIQAYVFTLLSISYMNDSMELH